jgi:hypothetical protein
MSELDKVRKEARRLHAQAIENGMDADVWYLGGYIGGLNGWDVPVDQTEMGSDLTGAWWMGRQDGLGDRNELLGLNED